MSCDILCVKRDVLFENKVFQGFLSKEEHDFSKRILENFDYVHRDDALENNPDFQQIIPYVWIINPKTKKAFIYKRSKQGGEGRIHHKISGGVGGHIDRDTEESSQNPVVDAMMRELQEEVTIQNYPTPNFVGFLNDDSEPVGKVHFGVVAIAETTQEVKPAMHMAEGKFYSVQEIEEIFANPDSNVENWTKLSWPFIKKKLSE